MNISAIAERIIPLVLITEGISVDIKLITKSSEDEMISVFLRGGRDSPRESVALTEVMDRLGISWEVLENKDSQEARRRVLSEWFGWGQYESVFGGMPDDVEWFWAELSLDYLRDQVYSIRWHFEETLGTRNVAELVAIDPPPDHVVEAIVGNVVAGRWPEPPILMGEPTLDRLVILEGHTRLTSYMARVDMIPFPLRVLVGVSTRIREWSEW